MHIRLTTIRGDAAELDAAVDYAENTARAVVESTPGNKGFTTLINRSTGVVLGASLWDSAEALASSEQSLSDTRDRVAAARHGSATIEHYEIAAAERVKIPAAGAVVRMRRSTMAPDKIDDGIAMFRAEALPAITSAPGACSALLLVDRETGTGITVTAWDDESALSRIEDRLDETRARAAEKVGLEFTDVATYTVVNTTAQLD
jgi:heme-degrading monooxygenase HmoA